MIRAFHQLGDQLIDCYNNCRLQCAARWYFKGSQYKRIKCILEDIQLRWSDDFRSKDLFKVKLCVLADLAKPEYRQMTRVAFDEMATRTLYKIIHQTMMPGATCSVYLQEAENNCLFREKLNQLDAKLHKDISDISKMHQFRFIVKNLTADLNNIKNPISLEELSYLIDLKYREDWRQIAIGSGKGNELTADILVPIFTAVLVNVPNDRLRRIIKTIDSNQEFLNRHPSVAYTLANWMQAEETLQYAGALKPL